MGRARSGEERWNRRQVLEAGGALALTLLLGPGAHIQPLPERSAGAVTVVCWIRYEIDPAQRESFRSYAESWGRIIPRCGGHLIGYFLPYEGTNHVGWGLIGFESLAAYEQYRSRLRADPEAVANFQRVQQARAILREERTFVEVVDGTFERPAMMGGAR